MKKFSNRSLNNLGGIDEKLIYLCVATLYSNDVDFTIINGYRTLEEQQALYKKGVTKCDGVKNKSRHQMGLAIDFIPYPFNGDWNKEQFEPTVLAFKETANLLGIKIKCGYDWGWDSGHIELVL